MIFLYFQTFVQETLITIRERVTVQRQYAEQCAAIVNDQAPLIEEGEALVKDAKSDLLALKAFNERLNAAVQPNTFDKLIAEVLLRFFFFDKSFLRRRLKTPTKERALRI